MGTRDAEFIKTFGGSFKEPSVITGVFSGHRLQDQYTGSLQGDTILCATTMK